MQLHQGCSTRLEVGVTAMTARPPLVRPFLEGLSSVNPALLGLHCGEYVTQGLEG